MKLIASTLLSLCLSATGLTIEGFEPDEKVVYKTVDDTKLKLHFFYPEGHKKTDSRPAIIFFFGGGWNGGSPSQFHPQCKYFASRGLVTASAEYRVKSRHKTTPQECVKDGKSAVRWLKINAGKYGIDPTKVLAGGGSAGGHVAAATGTLKAYEEEGEDTSVSSSPVALLLFNPVYDNSEKGYGYDRVKDYWEDISPSHNISKSTPPTITFFGDKDSCHTPEVAKAFHDKLNAQEIKNKFYLYKGQKHGFFNFGRNDHFKITLLEADKFLQKLGYLEGKANGAIITSMLEKHAANKKKEAKKEE